MKKLINKFGNIKTRPIVKSAMINIIVFIILNLLSYSKFACNIDIMMQSVISNIYGGADASYVIFMNIFITKILKTLSEVYPAIAWYTILLVFICFVSLTLIGQRYLSEKSKKMHVLIYSIFCLFIGFECYIYPSYIKSAFVLCFSMLLQLAYMLETTKKKWLRLLGCVLGLLFSGMLSKTGFFFGIVIGIFYYVLTNTYHKCWDGKCIIQVVTLIVSVWGVMILWGMNDKIYASHLENWGVIKEYRNAIEKVEVFGYPDLTRDTQEKMGMSENQYDIIKGNDQYIAVGTVGVELIKKISEEKMEWNVDSIIKYFHTVPVRWIKVSFTYLLLVVCIFLGESNADDKKKRIIISLAWIVISYLLSYMSGIWNSKVTHFMIFIPIVYWTMCGIGEEFEVSVREACIFLTVFSMVLYYNFSDQFVSSVTEKSIEETLDEMTLEGSVTAVDLNYLLGQYSTYKAYPKNLLIEKNIIVVNGNYGIYNNFEPYMYKQALWDVPIWWYGNWMDMNYYRIQ